MAINISEDINVTTGGKLSPILNIQGGWRTVADKSDMYDLTGSAAKQGLLENGMVFYVSSSRELYTLDITGNFPFYTYNFNEYNWPGSLTTASVSSNVITFTKGDSSTFNITVDTGSGGGGGSGDITAVNAGLGISGGASSGAATVTLDTGSIHFISGSTNLNIWQKTGSFHSTTKDIQITGSLFLNDSVDTDVFSITSASIKTFSVTGDGILNLISQSSTPTPAPGALYLDTNYDLYIGQ